MILFLTEYFTIFYFLIICILLVFVMIKLAQLMGPKKVDDEKLSAYECGFEPFINARVKFDITFILIALLFLVFDIELVYLVPWILHYEQIGFLGYCSVLIFILILFLGFLIEWCRGVLDWDRDVL